MLASGRVLRHPGTTAASGRQPILLPTVGSRTFIARESIRCQAAAQQHPLHAAAAGVAASLLLLSSNPAYANPVFEGPARVVDGDTLYIGKDKIRLFGVDAPEKTQMCNNERGLPYACGVASLEALKERVGTRPVRCEVKNKDQYGRNVAACSISPDLPFQQPEDMGAFLVSNGYAVAYRAYGKDYVPIEEQAQSSHKGIWAGKFTEPALWRKQQKAASLNASLASAGAPLGSSSSVGAGSDGKPSYAAVVAGAGAAGAGGGVLFGGQQQQQQGVTLAGGVSGASAVFSSAGVPCNGPIVKGNINAKGQKIYHIEKSGQYSRVLIEENKGERYFCTEEEALAAGWVAAKK